ncbi:MAG: lipopolysaccharide heptosyltransferase I [Nevskia sp.]|nr:lipopolysaccharide heptosyltransferase I [Nevskia sp.]
MRSPRHILIVKTSSLGDVLHALPAVTDAARALPDLRCDWLVEQAFAEIPAWHPAVERVIRCDLRGWRRNLRQTVFGGDWSRFRAELRQTEYDLVLDAQGLVKSAWLARQARGPVAGPDRSAAREPLAALFYTRGYAIPRHDQAHAVERTRRLFAQALGYPLPGAPPDAGLDRARFPVPDLAQPYAVLLHATTWSSKRWPLPRWGELGAWLGGRGLRPVLPWGSEAERADAETIAAACGGLVLPRLSLTELGGWLAHARLCVGVDTGLAHLAAALGTPQVTLYGPTLPQLTGAVGASQVWLRSGEDRSIDRERPTTVEVARVQEALQGLVS